MLDGKKNSTKLALEIGGGWGGGMKSLRKGHLLTKIVVTLLQRVPKSLKIGYLFRVIHFQGEVEDGDEVKVTWHFPGLEDISYEKIKIPYDIPKSLEEKWG